MARGPRQFRSICCVGYRDVGGIRVLRGWPLEELVDGLDGYGMFWVHKDTLPPCGECAASYVRNVGGGAALYFETTWPLPPSARV